MALSKKAKVFWRVMVNIVGILIWLVLLYFIHANIFLSNFLAGIDRLSTGDIPILIVIWGIYPAIVFLGGNILLTRLFRKSDKPK